MGRNAARRRIGNPKRRLEWAREHRDVMVRTVMARTRCTQAKAEELVDRFLAGPQSRAPRGLSALLKQLLLSIPLIGALVKVRRD